MFRNYFLKFLAVCTGILSVAVVWSEVTFFTQSPVLSLFAIIVNEAKEKYDYFTIEVFIYYSYINIFDKYVFIHTNLFKNIFFRYSPQL